MASPAPPSPGLATRPVKRSFTIAGHRTSISLEQAFWTVLKDAAARDGMSVSELVRRIDGERGGAGLSGAVRVWILTYAMQRSGPGTTDSLT